VIPSWSSCHLLLPVSAFTAVKLADLSTYRPVQIPPTTSDFKEVGIGFKSARRS